jgi:hypothetical protein
MEAMAAELSNSAVGGTNHILSHRQEDGGCSLYDLDAAQKKTALDRSSARSLSLAGEA